MDLDVGEAQLIPFPVSWLDRETLRARKAKYAFRCWGAQLVHMIAFSVFMDLSQIDMLRTRLDFNFVLHCTYTYA